MRRKHVPAARLCFALACFVLAPAVAQESRSESGGESESARYETLDRIVAVVGNDTITRTELSAQARLFARELAAQKKQAPPPEVLEARLIEQMVMEKLQTQEAERLGIQVDELAIDRAMEDIAERNKMTLEELRRATEKGGISYTELRERMRSQILIRRLIQQAVVNQISVSAKEIDDELKKQNFEVKREYRFARIDADPRALQRLRDELEGHPGLNARDLRRGLRGLAPPDDTDGERAPTKVRTLKWLAKDALPRAVRGVVDAMRDGTFGPVIDKRGGAHMYVLLETRDNLPDSDASNTVYLTRHILIRPNVIDEPDIVERRLARMRRDIESGERTFEDLARRHSEDPISRLKGGDLGWVPAEGMAPEFAERMRGAALGEVVGPFSTSFGLHLLQVLDAREGKSGSSELRFRVESEIRRRKSVDELRRWRIELRNSRHVEVRLRRLRERGEDAS